MEHFSYSQEEPRRKIGARIREWRKGQKLTQAEAASLLGIPFSTLQKYEMDLRVPGGISIETFIKAGVNANWLLTGEGEMLLGFIPPAHQLIKEDDGPYRSTLLRSSQVRAAIEAVEEGLVAAERSLSPDKKANLILAVYELLDESEASKERILNLVRFAA